MKKIGVVRSLLLILALTLLAAGCGGGGGSDSGPSATFPLDPGNINLIFVVSPDLAYQAPATSIRTRRTSPIRACSARS